jgi:hypothetical protein
MASYGRWLETPTRFYSQPQSLPAPAKDAPKQRPLMVLTDRTATLVTLFRFSFPKNLVARLSTLREYSSRVQGNKEWFPALVAFAAIKKHQKIKLKP